MTKESIRLKYLENRVKIARMELELYEELLENVRNEPTLSLEDLRIEIDSIDNVALGPRRDIGPRGVIDA